MNGGDAPEDFEDERHELLFAAQKSQRYHSYRVRFFERGARGFTILNLIFGASTVIALLKTWPVGAMYAAATVTVLSAVDLVVEFGGKARDHRDLMRRFNFLEQLLRSPKEYTEETHSDLFQKRLKIEADEPPILRVLDAKCHNEMVRAYESGEAQLIPIAWYQRLFDQWFDIGSHGLNKNNFKQ